MSRSPIRPDLVVTLADAQAIVDRIKPGLTVARVAELHGGDIGAVYEARLGGGEPSLVIKIYPERFPWKLAKEVAIYHWLAGVRELPVPTVLWSDDSKTLLRLGFAVMTRLDGESLAQVESGLAGGELSDIYTQMGRILRRFHDLHLDAFGYLVADGVKDPHPSNGSYMRFQFAKKLQEFRELGGDPNLGARMERYVDAHAGLLAACAQPVFCHDDFHPGNLIVAQNREGDWRLTGVVDVENAIAGDPLLDLAKALLFGAGANPLKRDAILAGYGRIERADWEKTIALYQLYHALETWDWLMRIGVSARPWAIEHMERITAAPG